MKRLKALPLSSLSLSLFLPVSYGISCRDEHPWGETFIKDVERRGQREGKSS